MASIIMAFVVTILVIPLPCQQWQGSSHRDGNYTNNNMVYVVTGQDVSLAPLA